MKKTYIAPQSASFNFQTEGLIASSVLGNGNKSVVPSNQESNSSFRSNKSMWEEGSSIWGK